VRESIVQIREPLGAEQQLANNQQRPTLPHHVERARHATGVAVAAFAGHADILLDKSVKATI
jgi:hypothetical protein